MHALGAIIARSPIIVKSRWLEKRGPYLSDMTHDILMEIEKHQPKAGGLEAFLYGLIQDNIKVVRQLEALEIDQKFTELWDIRRRKHMFQCTVRRHGVRLDPDVEDDFLAHFTVRLGIQNRSLFQFQVH